MRGLGAAPKKTETIRTSTELLCVPVTGHVAVRECRVESTIGNAVTAIYE